MEKRLVQLISLVVTMAVIGGCAWGIAGGFKIDPRLSKPQVFLASFSPSGEVIAIRVDGKRLHGLFLIDKQGRARTWLTAWGGRPAFSPAGDKIAFPLVRETGSGDIEIYLMDSDGSNLRLFAHSPQVEKAPSFSPDGRRLCYLQARNEPVRTNQERKTINDGSIMCKPLAGGEEERLSEVWLGKDFWFAFLPDGKEMVIRTHTFCGVGANKREFWIMDPAKPEDRKLINLDLRQLLHPDERRFLFCNLGSANLLSHTALSRNGRFLAFSLRYLTHGSFWNEPSRDHLFVADLDTCDIVGLGDNEEGVQVRDISADGGQILFTTKYGHDLQGDRLDPSNLWIINRDGSGLRNIPLDFSAVAAQGPVNDLESLRQAPPAAKP